MGTYGQGTKCDKLWCVWHGILLAGLHLFLIYRGVVRYLSYKFLAFDPKFGGDWDQTGLNFALAMLIGAIGSFCLFLFVSLIRTTNYANESIQIGRELNSINTLSLGQSWRSAMPLTTLPPTFLNRRTCTTGSIVNGGPVQRPHFTTLSGGSEDEHASVLAGEENLPTGGIYDTWPRRGAMHHDTYNPYNAMNMLHCVQDAESPNHLSIGKSFCFLWRQVQRHFLPYANVLHLLTAYCLLLPIPVMQAQQIYHGALDVDWTWRSDLDFIFGCSSTTERKSIQLGGASVAVSSNDRDSSGWENLRALSPEFFNLALAFILLVLRYPSVFWYTNRSFSFVFSLLIFMTGIHALIEHSAASVLVKFAWNAHSLPHIPSIRLISAHVNLPIASSPRRTVGQTSADQLPTPVDSDIDRPPSPSILGGVDPLLLSTLGTLFFLLLCLTVFEYGYRQFLDNLVSYRMYLIESAGTHGETQAAATSNLMDRNNGGVLPNGPGLAYNPSESGQSGMNGSGKFNHCFNGSSFLGHKSPSYSLGAELLHPATRCCLFTYSPHLCAMIGSLCVLAIKFPLIWDCIQLYRATRCVLLLASPLSGIVLFCVWFIAWFAFGLKPAWKFQVSLPVHSIPGPAVQSESGMLSHFQAPANGSIMSPILMGSSPAPPPIGYGSRNDPIGPMFTPQGQFPPNGPLTPRVNCFISDDGSVTHTGVPSSPTYACFHASYQGAVPSAISRGVRFATNMDSAMASTVASGLQPGPVVDATNHEHCVDDTEASSSKQSGSNYVCLHSGFPNAGWDASSTHGVLVPTEPGGIFSQLSQPGTQCVVRMPCTSLPHRTQTSFVCAESTIPGLTANTANVVSSTPLEQEPRSSNTAYSAGTIPHTGAQEGTTHQSNSLRPRNLLVNYLPSSPAQKVVTAVTRIQAPNGINQAPTNSLLCASAYNRSQSIENPSTSKTTPVMAVSLPGQRVTFGRNIELLPSVSSGTNDIGPQNNSSDDSGIDNFKVDRHNPTGTELHSINQPFGSGSYDNAFPTSNTTVHRSDEGSRIPQELIAVSSVTFPSMSDSIYSTHVSTFATNSGGKPCPLQSVLIEPGFRNMLTSTNEMIGDASDNCQCSTSEHFPLLVCPELLVDKNPEARLCSQV